jgi:hypothetical protein
LFSGTVDGGRVVGVIVEVNYGRLALAFVEHASTEVNWRVCHGSFVELLLGVADRCGVWVEGIEGEWMG